MFQDTRTVYQSHNPSQDYIFYSFYLELTSTTAKASAAGTIMYGCLVAASA